MSVSRQCLVFRVPMAGPGDTAPLTALFERGVLRPAEIVAIFGKTEGNGCVNDFTRPYAVEALKNALAPRLDCKPEAIGRRIGMVMSGGTEGGLSPHFLVFATRDSDARPDGAKRLAIGSAATRPFRVDEIGRLPQIEETARAVREAIAAAAIEDDADVHFVQVKCPLITAERHAEAVAAGRHPATHNTYASMGLSRGASALGIALALGEVAEGALSDAAVCRDFGLWSGRASASAGIELMHNEIIVLGNSPRWTGDAVIGHAVMRDAIDLPAIHEALGQVGMTPSRQLGDDQRDLLWAVLAKAEPSSDGRIRGNRHIMLDDSDIQATRHARALVGGVIGGLIGRTDLFVSGGAEHQGPDGGGPVAMIAEVR
jgi:cyanuric acid amidohydrolase